MVSKLCSNCVFGYDGTGDLCCYNDSMPVIDYLEVRSLNNNVGLIINPNWAAECPGYVFDPPESFFEEPDLFSLSLEEQQQLEDCLAALDRQILIEAGYIDPSTGELLPEYFALSDREYDSFR